MEFMRLSGGRDPNPKLLGEKSLPTCLDVDPEELMIVGSDGNTFKKAYFSHIEKGLPAIILVGYGLYTMHYAIALIMLRGIPSSHIFIVDKASVLGGGLAESNTWAFFIGPFEPRNFYPPSLYRSCYHRMRWNNLGLDVGCALYNMFQIKEHFGLQIFLNTSFNEIEGVIDSNTRVMFPCYRDITSGKSDMLKGGIDTVDLSSREFHIIGSGISSADVLLELVLRRCKSHGRDFRMVLHYRTARMLTTYFGPNCFAPGIHPLKYLLQVSRGIDSLMFGQIKNPSLDAYRKDFSDPKTQLLLSKKPFSGMAGMLMAHPALMSRLLFKKIRDRNDVNVPPSTLLDCTNEVENLRPSDTGSHIDFQPDLVLSFYSIMFQFATLTSPRNLPNAFISPMTTAGAACAHVMNPSITSDARTVGAQKKMGTMYYWDGVGMYAPYHMCSRFFCIDAINHGPLIIQIGAMLLYPALMTLFAWTGLTLLFFHHDWFTSQLFNDSDRAYDMAKRRWEWYSQQTGHMALFPINSLAQLETFLPPQAISYKWIARSRTKLQVRFAFFSLFLFVGIATLFLPDRTSKFAGALYEKVESIYFNFRSLDADDV